MNDIKFFYSTFATGNTVHHKGIKVYPFNSVCYVLVYIVA